MFLFGGIFLTDGGRHNKRKPYDRPKISIVHTRNLGVIVEIVFIPVAVALVRRFSKSLYVGSRGVGSRVYASDTSRCDDGVRRMRRLK